MIHAPVEVLKCARKSFECFRATLNQKELLVYQHMIDAPPKMMIQDDIPATDRDMVLVLEFQCHRQCTSIGFICSEEGITVTGLGRGTEERMDEPYSANHYVHL